MLSIRGLAKQKSENFGLFRNLLNEFWLPYPHVQVVLFLCRNFSLNIFCMLLFFRQDSCVKETNQSEWKRRPVPANILTFEFLHNPYMIWHLNCHMLPVGYWLILIKLTHIDIAYALNKPFSAHVNGENVEKWRQWLSTALNLLHWFSKRRSSVVSKFSARCHWTSEVLPITIKTVKL